MDLLARLLALNFEREVATWAGQPPWKLPAGVRRVAIGSALAGPAQRPLDRQGVSEPHDFGTASTSLLGRRTSA